MGHFNQLLNQRKVPKYCRFSFFAAHFSVLTSSACNLKKILALVLAFACAFTMFAGAAFTDQADIKVDSDVVDTLVSLGVVEGFENGSFQPNATVTRAQMAKMIYVLRTGKSDASAYNDDKTSFTDINGHWARGYIKYCQSLGIIAGKSSTTFAPNLEVTAQEAAKMLLVTLGYDAEKAGLVGTGWAAKTNALADEAGLLDDVNTSFTGPCPRQYAAQLIYNTLDANTVVWRDDAYTKYNYSGAKNPTVGQKYMGLMDTDDSILLSVKEDSRGTFTVKALAEGSVVTFTKVDKDYTDLLGQKVDVLAKATDKVYGIYATSANDVAVKSTVGDLDKLKADNLKIDGTKYDVVSTARVYTTEVATDTNRAGDKVINTTAGAAYATGAGFNGMDTASTVYAVSYDEDEKIDLFVVIPAQVAKVTNVSSSSVVLSGIGSIDTEDYVAYEGLKKDDYVLYIKDNKGTAYKDTLDKIDVVTATVDGVKGGNEFLIDGDYYKAGTGVTKTPKAGDKIEAALYGSRFYSMDINAATSVEDMLVVYAAGKRSDGVATGVEAKVLFADGTKSTVNISKMVSPKDSADEYNIATAAHVEIAATGTTAAQHYAGTNNAWGTNDAYLEVGALYTYEKDGNDYKLTPVTANNDAGFDTINAISNTAYVKSNDRATLGGNRIDDTATIFVIEKLNGVKSSDADAKVITGKSLSSWSNAWGSFTQTATNTNNGVKTVMAAVVADTTYGYGVNDDTYGIVNSDVVRVYGADGKRYYQFKLWNGSADETVYTKNAGLDKGDVVTFDDDDKVGDIRVLKTTVVTGSDAALLGVDGKYVTITKAADAFNSNASAEYKVTDDTSVLFIEDDKAVAGTVADLDSYKATKTSDENVFVPNAQFILNSAKTEFEMIVVDVRGYLAKYDSNSYAVTATPATYIDGFNPVTKTITLKANADADDIKGELTHALAVKVTKTSTDCKATAGQVVIVDLIGNETTYTVTATTNSIKLS